MNGFGQRLKEFAAVKFGSQKGLADALGVFPARITNYVQEVNQPDPDTLFQLNKFGCNINWLLTGEGEMLHKPDENAAKIERIKAIINE